MFSVSTWKLCGTSEPVNLRQLEHWHEAFLSGRHADEEGKLMVKKIDLQRQDAVIEVTGLDIVEGLQCQI
jgi:hypothetical protein